jgi:hypothetical protein
MRFRDVGVVSAKKISIVVNDVSIVVQPSHFHVFLAVERSPIAEKPLLYVSGRARCDRHVILTRGKPQEAEQK